MEFTRQEVQAVEHLLEKVKEQLNNENFDLCMTWGDVFEVLAELPDKNMAHVALDESGSIVINLCTSNIHTKNLFKKKVTR